MAASEPSPPKDKTARLTASVAIVVALMSGATSGAIAVYNTNAQGDQSQAEFARTKRLDAYGKFNDAERDMRLAVDDYVGVRGNRYFPDFEIASAQASLKKVETAYTTLDKALGGVLVVGSDAAKTHAKQVQLSEKERLNVIRVDVSSIANLIAERAARASEGNGSASDIQDGEPREYHFLGQFDTVTADVDAAYDRFTQHAGQELSAQ